MAFPLWRSIHRPHSLLQLQHQLPYWPCGKVLAGMVILYVAARLVFYCHLPCIFQDARCVSLTPEIVFLKNRKFLFTYEANSISTELNKKYYNIQYIFLETSSTFRMGFKAAYFLSLTLFSCCFMTFHTSVQHTLSK